MLFLLRKKCNLFFLTIIKDKLILYTGSNPIDTGINKKIAKSRPIFFRMETFFCLLTFR